MACAWKRSRQTSQVTATPLWSSSARTPTTSPSSTETFPDLPATRSPNTSSPLAAACRSSCSPLPTVSTTRRPGSSSAPMTTSRSRSSSESSCSVSEPSTAGAPTTGRPCERSQGCGWIRSAERSIATAATSRSPESSSQCSKSSSLPTAVSSAPKSSWREHGTRTQTRSPTPCASPSRDCGNGSASPGSSPPSPAPATASTRNETEKSVDRAPGLSVRLKLTLSYAGFLMLAGAVLLVVGYFSLSRGVHPGVIFMVRSHADLLRAFAPTAAIVMAFLLVFGLLGVWLLAGRMLAPLTRITDATRIAATGSLSHRIQLDGRKDEFRELADVFDAMLARLEAHVAEQQRFAGEQQRFAANASHELRTPLAITQTLLEVARNDQSRRNDELVDRLHAVNTRAIDLTEALLLLSRADQRSFVLEHADLSLVAEEATETLLPFAEARGVTIETSGDVTPTIGSRALLLQLSTNLVHNAIVHNLPDRGTVWVTTSAGPTSALLTVENTGEKVNPQLASTLDEPF